MSIEVTFIEADGRKITGQATAGQSLMRAAQELGVTGILAECGGMCACSTCHCYISAEWSARLDPLDDMEDGMLELAYDRTGESRLSCQITVTPELDGLIARLPERQA
ncbi:2Fe-2S iron-sulfur cluster-binding protein [Actinoplanes derwentensis]|uniref:Ferredoxin, 2Fe-2S n=1 Tax=Actinoplanes derwentensis TaxID=113562 RepID=A0A1H2DDF6_9ACTN|nr:2Fe-2S iron-sulfur cluster-binding protein [Actinoplanes derwentensis]GID90192.1 ferredoxin [Actinoplanes derwentensis]SDT80286.1 ferredoxin, 2Fe-2S [Actinoplanes derwentensis]